MATAKNKTTPAAGETDKPRGKLVPAEPPPKPSLVIGKNAAGTDITLHKLEQVTVSLERLVPNILQLEAASERAKITDEVMFNKGSTFCSSCDEQWDQIETLRKAVKRPLDDYVKLVQALFTPYQRRLEVVRDKVKGMMTTFYRAEEQRKRDEAAAQRKLQEEQAQAVAAAHEEAGNTEVAQAVLDAAVSAPAPSTQVTLGQERNALGEKTQVRKSWKGAVVNRVDLLKAVLEGKVPWVVIEFKQSEIHTVARQVQAEGVIHGIKVTHEADLSFRS